MFAYKLSAQLAAIQCAMILMLSHITGE